MVIGKEKIESVMTRFVTLFLLIVSVLYGACGSPDTDVVKKDGDHNLVEENNIPHAMLPDNVCLLYTSDAADD